jgi:Domain of unknown function (DUF4397)
MSFNLLHLGRLLGAAAIVATLTGCGSISANPSISQVRVVAASPDTPGVDIYQGSEGLAYNLRFGTITSYVPVTPGTYAISAATAGTRQTLSLAKPTFAGANQYTVLIGNTLNSLQQLTLRDQNHPAPPGEISLRFVDQATRSGPVDVYLVPAGHALITVNPTLTNVHFGDNTGYQTLPAGTYTLVMVPTGIVPTSGTIPTFTGPRLEYSPTSARTIILLDQPLPVTSSLQVITAIDYDSPDNN